MPKRNRFPNRKGKGAIKSAGNKISHCDFFKSGEDLYVHGPLVKYRDIRRFLPGFCLRKTHQAVEVTESFFNKITIPAQYAINFLHLQCGNGVRFLIGKPAESEIVKHKYPKGLHENMTVIKIATKAIIPSFSPSFQ